MKPSKFAAPIIHYSTWFPFNPFAAITLFGHVFVRQDYKDTCNTYEWNETVYHETIHILQAVHENDSWFRFYLKYLGYWIRNMFHCNFKNSTAYHCIPYEMEAHYQDVFWSSDKSYDCRNLNKFKKFPYKTAIERYETTTDWHMELTKML